MSELSSAPAFGKKFSEDFAETIGKEKNARIASEALRDLMLFNNALESELQQMMSAMQKGAALDHQLLDKMSAAKDKYNYAMSGFKAFDDEMQRFALTSLADAIQDLMFYIHSRKKH